MTPSIRRTTFFIPNLHCPSCTAHIEDALYRLSPPPVSISASIISHAVTVAYPSTLSVADLSKALDEAGFEIFDVLQDPAATAAAASSSSSKSVDNNNQDEEKRGIPSFAFEQALWKWRPHTLTPDGDKRTKHIKNCTLCQSQAARAGVTEKSLDVSESLQGNEKLPFVAAESTLAAVKLVQATLAIEGMTCSSCVGSVTRALEEQPFVESASVSLLTHSASVKLYGEHHARDLTEVVEDVGFGAVLEQVEELELEEPAPGPGNPDLWKATYAVGGMTCSSCVGSVTRALEELSWVKEVDVALITNSATIIFEGKSHLEEIEKTIEDLGYEAKLDTVIDLHTETPTAARRKVSIHISGMYCQHCPLRIEKTIQGLGQITIEKLPSMQTPILSLSYVPEPPRITIRQILAALSETDEAFVATVYHPMSLEERSRRMQTREQWHMLYRVILAVVAAIPAFILGIVYMNLVPKTNTSRRYLSRTLHGVPRIVWATFIIATPVYFFAADVFHRRTLKELRALWRPGSPTPILRRFYRFGSMNMLISFGTTIAYFASIAEVGILATTDHKDIDTNMSANPTYFDSVVFLTMFLLIGRLIEAYTKAKTGDAVAELGKLRPKEALLLDSEMSQARGGESTRKVGLDQLEIGDIVRVLNGASPPFDGFVVDGESNFDESSLTGESRPISKAVGDEVFAGTINKDAPISVRISGVSGNSMLDQIMKVVRDGQARRAPVERIADILTGYFVPIITLIAISTWVIWMVLGLTGSLPAGYLDIETGGWSFWALEFAIAVFVVACPCGIGLAAPTALFVGGGLAAKHGILAKGGGEAFQEASDLDCIVFDKTGTLTHGGEPRITEHAIFKKDCIDIQEATVLGVVRALESESSHPIAKALVAFCQRLDSQHVMLEQVNEVAGKGMRASLIRGIPEVQEALLGNEALMSDFSVPISAEAGALIESWKREGNSIALLALKSSSSSAPGWNLFAAFAVSDPPRPEAYSVVKALQQRKINVWMISGDNPTTAYAVGEQVGIPRENIIAGVLPSEKADRIKHLQRYPVSEQAQSSSALSRILKGSKNTPKTAKQRATVAMVGDGINDSPALTAADVGIAIGSGSDVAISSAEFVLLTSNLTALLTLTDLSRAIFRRIKFNFGWALIYNLLAVPLAAGVLYPLKTLGNDPDHIRLNPVWAALAMALSSISVVCSSLLLRTRLPLVGFRAKRLDQ